MPVTTAVRNRAHGRSRVHPPGKPKPKTWVAPQLWPGGECFILGGGPSLGDIDISILKDRRVIAVNQAYKLGDWIDVLFFGDCRWWFNNKDALLNWGGLKVTTCIQHVDKPGIKVIARRNAPIGDLSNDRGTLAWNLSSGACAINLAVHFGVKRIVLLGFDMKPRNSNRNWHQDYPKPVSTARAPYARFLKPFTGLAAKLKTRHIEVVNACPGSALTVFPIVTIEDVL